MSFSTQAFLLSGPDIMYPDALTPFELDIIIRTKMSEVLIIDSRTFAFGRNDCITGAHVIKCPPIVKRRSGGCIPVANIITDETTRAKLLSREFSMIVVYDDACENFLSLNSDADMKLVVKSLAEDQLAERILYLQGGYSKFCDAYPHWCGGLPLATAELPGTTTSQQPSISLLQLPTPKPSREFAHNKLTGPAEVLPHLFIGSAEDAANRLQLESVGVTAILNVTSDLENAHPSAFTYMTIPIQDSLTADLHLWFDEAASFIDDARCCGGKTLVHCRAGVSRSAAICIAYLMRSLGWTLDESFSHLSRVRRAVEPNLSFMSQLQAYEGRLRCQRHRRTTVQPADDGGSTTTAATCATSLLPPGELAASSSSELGHRTAAAVLLSPSVASAGCSPLFQSVYKTSSVVFNFDSGRSSASNVRSTPIVAATQQPHYY